MEKLVTEYRTVEARVPFAMEAMMQELLSDGYQPYVYSEPDDSIVCCQAMVKYYVVEPKYGYLDVKSISQDA